MSHRASDGLRRSIKGRTPLELTRFWLKRQRNAAHWSTTSQHTVHPGGQGQSKGSIYRKPMGSSVRLGYPPSSTEHFRAWSRMHWNQPGKRNSKASATDFDPDE